MKSWLSRIKSSFNPLAFKSSPKCSLHWGSKASNFANLGGAAGSSWYPFTLPDRLSLTGADTRGDSGGVGADECRCPPKRPPNNPWCLWWFEGAAPPNGVFSVALLAFFSRSFIFFKNCFASFSSTKDNPARHSSSSKV
jgi:hypothetical protein